MNGRMTSLFLTVMATGLGITGLSACRSETRTLVGKYHLVNAANCREDLQGSTLTLRSDGTYDEQAYIKAGQIEHVENEHWDYDERTRQMHFSRLLVSPERSFAVEASHPGVIFVNRAGGCWYGQSK